ncbi:hypothetical protein [Agarilytica rhodophyticola]|uniref:hypothetical protein n=1 Tax=Agarilytica rhodophyticola TaxID=1737490 RepID=UPI000CD93469|nr:hypothetical protein [Agarilytica rhodophyticola]
MKYLAVSVLAVVLAILFNWISTAINFFVIFGLFTIVLIWLLYQAQLLPEEAMVYFDNRIIHDGQKSLETTYDNFISDDADDNNSSLDTSPIDDVEIQEVDQRISPDQELVNIILEKSSDLDIEIHPLEELCTWISTVDSAVAEREVMLLVEKLNQASGLSRKVRLRFNGESIEVQV